MLEGQELWPLVLCFCFLIAAAFGISADPKISKQCIKAIRAPRYNHLFAVVSGNAVGADVGVLLGSGSTIKKGLMIGGSGLSALYLHSHRGATLKGWRNWANIGYSVFVGGLEWTICG